MTIGGHRPTSCDDENIHLISAVQPHGAIIVADPSSAKVIHTSANIDEFVGVSAVDLL